MSLTSRLHLLRTEVENWTMVLLGADTLLYVCHLKVDSPEASMTLRAAAPGRVMAHYYIALDTMVGVGGGFQLST